MEAYRNLLDQMPKKKFTDKSTTRFSVIQPDPYHCTVCDMTIAYREVMPMRDQHLYTRDLCECEKIAEELANREWIEEISRDNLRAGSGIHGELANKKIDDITGAEMEKAKKVANQYINHFPHDKWLLLSGSYGVGKTHLACAIGNELLKNMVSVKFISIPSFLEEIKKSYDKESSYINPMRTVLSGQMIILDELGAGYGKEDWLQDQIYMLINNAYMKQIPMVITTNCRSIKELEFSIGGRTTDRILHKAVWVDITSQSYRKSQYLKRGNTIG